MTPAYTLFREYVYGLESIDEHVLQIDPVNGYFTYMLQDVSGNVVAAIDIERINDVEQSFDPYGGWQIVNFPPFASAGIDPDDGSADTEEYMWTVAGLHGHMYDRESGLYNMRGRYFDADLGRYLSADPNGTGLVYASSLTYHGTPFTISPGFHPFSQHADGPSPYEFVRSNPITGRDPSGLKMNHWVPLYLGGTMEGPVTDIAHEAHEAFHRFLDVVEGGKYSRNNGDAARNFARLSHSARKALLKQAGAVAGFTNVELDEHLNSGLRKYFTLGRNNTEPVRKYSYLVDLVPENKQIWERGRIAADFLNDVAKSGRVSVRSRFLRGAGMAVRGGGKALPVLGLAFTASTLLDAASNPFVWDIAKTNGRYQRTGRLDMIDEVFILYDLYQVTNDYIGSNVGYATWLEMNDF